MPKITIDLTPSWGEWANIYRRFAQSGERSALQALEKDHARMAAFAAAFCDIHCSLPADLASRAETIYAAELAKQGQQPASSPR